MRYLNTGVNEILEHWCKWDVGLRYI